MWNLILIIPVSHILKSHSSKSYHSIVSTLNFVSRKYDKKKPYKLPPFKTLRQNYLLQNNLTSSYRAAASFQHHSCAFFSCVHLFHSLCTIVWTPCLLHRVRSIASFDLDFISQEAIFLFGSLLLCTTTIISTTDQVFIISDNLFFSRSSPLPLCQSSLPTALNCSTTTFCAITQALLCTENLRIVPCSLHQQL